MTRGERVCAFIERYIRIPEGDSVGNPLVLEEFQRRWILEVYDNPYGTRRAYLSISRKNGKTALLAALLLCAICGPEARWNTQIVSGAMSREQAAIVFDLAVKMVNLSPEMSRLIRIVPSGKRLIGLTRNVTFKALSADGKRQQGLSPVLAFLDEVGQVRGPRSEFISAITTSQGAYQDALLLVISTQAPSNGDLFSIWIDSQKAAPDPRVVSHVYSAPEDCDLMDRTAWFAANPGLGKFKAISDLEMDAKLATEMPSEEGAFRNLQLNQRVESVAPFVTRKVWESNGTDPGPLEGKRVYAGLDLSSVNDLTALVLVSEEGDIHCRFWLPKHGLIEKSKKDHVPYDVWAREGHLITTPGRAIEYKNVAESLRGIFDAYDIQTVGFDRYNMEHLKSRLREADFSDQELDKFKPFGQGWASMTPALRELEVKLLNGQLKHGNHPVLTMCAANARVDGESGARKFVKAKAHARIDGMVALAMAIGVMPTAEQAPAYQMFFIGG